MSNIQADLQEEFIIREATEEDLPALLEIYNEAVLNTTATFDLEPLTLEQRRKWFLVHDKQFPLLVAEIQRTVGYCSLSRFREKPAYSRTAELSIYVDREFRRKRIASALMSKIVAMARNLGYHAIISGISGRNEASVKLHLRHGFLHIGTFKEVGYKFSEWQDVDFYELLL